MAAGWSTHMARRGRLSRRPVLFLWITLGMSLVRLPLAEEGPVEQVLPTVTPYLDQAIFCAWAPAAYLTAGLEYNRRFSWSSAALAFVSTVGIAALSLHIEQSDAATLLRIQQILWAAATLLLLWDAGLGGHRRDLTMFLFAAIGLELLIGGWIGIGDPEHYIVAQVLTGSLYACLPLVALYMRRTNRHA
jgi:hypothetical protein